ncbi:hypothetical protein SprV_0200957500 [Sparganum proliferum]
MLHGLPFVYACTDDLLGVRAIAEEHRRPSSTVFDRLPEFDFVLNPSKYLFGALALELPGNLINSTCIHPLPSKLAAIIKYPPPPPSPRFQASTAALSGHSSSGPSTDALVALADTAPTLAHFAPVALFSLIVDASNVVDGTILQQHLASPTQPLALFSRKLTPEGSRYSAPDGSFVLSTGNFLRAKI